MARNKNSTALFDVIHAAKKPPKASPSASIPTPRWWGKDRKDKKVPQPAPASTENVGRQQSWLTAAKKSTAATPPPVAVVPLAESAPADAPVENHAPIESTSVETTAEPAATAQPKQRFIDRFVSRTTTAEASAPAVVAAEPIAPAPAGSTEEGWTDSEFVQVKPDPNPQPAREPAIRINSATKEFRFNLSYGGMIAIGFIFVMALAIAFIAGRRTGGETAFDDGLPSTKDATATSSGMLAAVAPTKPAGAAVPGTLPVSLNVLNVGGHKPAVILKDPAGSPPTPSATVLPTNKTREIGLMYVIVQSYDDRELAQKACDFVNQQGVPCTLVQGPSQWAMHDWYSVVGLKPFTKHDPALPEYERNIKAIGTKFSNKILDQFTNPQAYTWRQDSDLGQQ